MVEYDAAIDNIQVNLEVRTALNILSIPISTTFVVFDEWVDLLVNTRSVFFYRKKLITFCYKFIIVYTKAGKK